MKPRFTYVKWNFTIGKGNFTHLAGGPCQTFLGWDLGRFLLRRHPILTDISRSGGLAFKDEPSA